MTVMDWVHEFQAQALLRGDQARLQLVQIHPEAYAYRQSQPQRMLAMLEQGRRQALVLGEPWWVLFFDHWRVETYIYYLDDFRTVIEKAVQVTLEARKPKYQGHPLQFSIHCNLVAAYLCVDPRGYATEIAQALDYLKDQQLTDHGDRYLLLARTHWFACELGEYDRAHQLALQELAWCDNDPDRYLAEHHEVDTYKALCRNSFRQKDWTRLQRYATQGEQHAKTIGYEFECALFLIWQGLVALLEQTQPLDLNSIEPRREQRREWQPNHFIRRGIRLMNRLGQPPDDSYFDALCHYHELRNELVISWTLREQHLAHTSGRGQLAAEAECRLKRCQLLVRMECEGVVAASGTTLTDEHEATRRAIARLRAPEWYLAEMAKISER